MKKNIIKVWGIIALVAIMVGTVVLVSCGEADADEIVSVQVKEFPGGADGYWGSVYLTKDGTDTEEKIAWSASEKQIRNGSYTTSMKNEKGDWGKKGDYYIHVEVYADNAGSPASLPYFKTVTDSKHAIKEGETYVLTVDKLKKGSN